MIYDMECPASPEAEFDGSPWLFACMRAFREAEQDFPPGMDPALVRILKNAFLLGFRDSLDGCPEITDIRGLGEVEKAVELMTRQGILAGAAYGKTLNGEKP